MEMYSVMVLKGRSSKSRQGRALSEGYRGAPSGLFQLLVVAGNPRGP